jgi:hypothetical protein
MRRLAQSTSCCWNLTASRYSSSGSANRERCNGCRCAAVVEAQVGVVGVARLRRFCRPPLCGQAGGRDVRAFLGITVVADRSGVLCLDLESSGHRCVSCVRLAAGESEWRSRGRCRGRSSQSSPLSIGRCLHLERMCDMIPIVMSAAGDTSTECRFLIRGLVLGRFLRSLEAPG